MLITLFNRKLRHTQRVCCLLICHSQDLKALTFFGPERPHPWATSHAFTSQPQAGRHLEPASFKNAQYGEWCNISCILTSHICDQAAMAQQASDKAHVSRILNVNWASVC
ncbi:hypothetical protein WJX82_004643 [Trebouxia sp. C0006]